VLVFCFAIQEMKRERLFKKYDEKDHTYSYFRLQMESVNADTAGILFLVMFLAWQTDSIRLAI